MSYAGRKLLTGKMKKYSYKDLAITNAKFFLFYLSIYLLINVLVAKSLSFSSFFDSVVPSWSENIVVWTIFAFIIISICMKKYIEGFHKNRILSFLLYFFCCAVLSNLWFWLCVFPGFIAYNLSGGVLR